MLDFLQRLRVPLLFACLVILALLAMLADRGARRAGQEELPRWSAAVLDVAVPLQRLIETPITAVQDTWSRYVALLDLREENDQLRERLIRLEEENLQFKEALVASGRLHRIAEMRHEFDSPILPTEVVGQDVSPWFRSVLLDRGREHGVRSGMPVITDRGVAGLVTATSAHAAKTMLLLDRQSAIDGMVQRSRARGIVRGQGTGRLEFEFTMHGDDVRAGDVVITSGLGGLYPKGLRVGEVVEVSGQGPDLIQRATLRPSVDFGRLEQMFVILRRGPTMDLLYGPEGDAAEAPSATNAPPSS